MEGMTTTLKIVSERHRVLKDGITNNSLILKMKDYDYSITFEQGTKTPEGQMNYNSLCEVPLYESDLDDLRLLFEGLSAAIKSYQWWSPERDAQQNTKFRRETPPDLVFFKGYKLVKDNYIIRCLLGFNQANDGSNRKIRYTKIQVYKSPDGFNWLTEMRNLDKQFKPWPKENLVVDMNIETMPSVNNVNIPADKQFADKLERLFRNVYDDSYNMVQTHREKLRERMIANGGEVKKDYSKTTADANSETGKVAYTSSSSDNANKYSDFTNDFDEFNF